MHLYTIHFPNGYETILCVCKEQLSLEGIKEMFKALNHLNTVGEIVHIVDQKYFDYEVSISTGETATIVVSSVHHFIP